MIEVRRIIKSIKRDPSDDFDTEYVDVDTLLNMYMNQFKEYKQKNQKDLRSKFKNVPTNEQQRTEISAEKMQELQQEAFKGK